jgi:hypothetical protein
MQTQYAQLLLHGGAAAGAPFCEPSQSCTLLWTHKQHAKIQNPDGSGQQRRTYNTDGLDRSYAAASQLHVALVELVHIYIADRGAD